LLTLLALLMNLEEFYKNSIRERVDDPKKALALIRLGLSLYSKGIALIPDKKLNKSLQYLREITVDLFYRPIKNPENAALVNLFTPMEILHSFGIYPLFGESFSSCLRSADLEDQYMDIAENKGATETMCGYHRALLGAAQTGLLPKFKFVATTSMVCDNNINTCREIANKYGLPFQVIDVPYTESNEAIDYVVGQLKELIALAGEVMDRKFEIDNLKRIIKLENDNIELMNKFNDELSTKFFPNSLGLEMSKLVTSYVFMGTREANNFYRQALEDIRSSEPRHNVGGLRRGNRKKIMWINILPSSHPVLDEYFSLSDKYQLIGTDFNLYSREKLDTEKPLEAIAKKMIRCVYNGAAEKKVKAVSGLIDKFKPDAMIHFNHWGCKQANALVGLIRDVAINKKMPFLSIDGDAIDQRNSHQGQTRTRVGAFLEILEKQNTKNN